MEHFIFTNTGNRECNEDYADVVKTSEGTFYIVADGLGGHGFGEAASKNAVLEAKRVAQQHQGKDICSIFEEIFFAANKKMAELQNQMGNNSYFKTTMVVLCVRDEDFIWGSIGDSRIYHFEENRIIERSMDHSVPQILVNAGKLQESKIRGHGDRSKLLKVLGAEQESVSPYIAELQPLTETTSFLLCTDGFWECIKEKKMEKCLRKTESAEDWIEKMTVLIEKNRIVKCKDNYTAIGIRLR